MLKNTLGVFFRKKVKMLVAILPFGVWGFNPATLTLFAIG